MRLFNAVCEVLEDADDWLGYNNEFRPQESLGNVPPVIYKVGFFNQNVSNSELSP